MKIEIREDVEETVAQEAEHRHRGAAGLMCGLHEGRACHVGSGRMRRAGVMDGHVTCTRKEGKSNGSKNKVV